MAKSFMFFFSLKTGAMIMALSNFVFAICVIIGCSVGLSYTTDNENKLYYIMAIIMGIFNVFLGTILTAALIKAKERYVLLYLVLEMTNLLILSIYAVFNMVFSTAVAAFLILCLILWYGLYCMYGFYMELAEYNSVKSGVIEISYNANINPVMVLPEKAIESTPV